MINILGIVELSWDNELKIIKSTVLKDKGEYYEAQFKFRTEYFIRKDMLGIPYIESGMWKNKLYVSLKKYEEDPLYWQDVVKKYRRLNDTRNWLQFE